MYYYRILISLYILFADIQYISHALPRKNGIWTHCDSFFDIFHDELFGLSLVPQKNKSGG